LIIVCGIDSNFALLTEIRRVFVQDGRDIIFAAGCISRVDQLGNQLRYRPDRTKNVLDIMIRKRLPQTVGAEQNTVERLQ